MRILIVDDEVNVATLLAESVRLQGHEVTVASTGREALALVEERRPDAVFLDIVMPHLNGIEVLRRIRETDPVLPVIVITGHASGPQLEEARHLGVTDVIEKPFALAHLNRAIGSLRPKKH